MAEMTISVAATPSDAEPTKTKVEHLHLHMKRTHWETKFHTNLGAHLQDALDALDCEGWEVAAAYVINQTPEVILRRAVA